MIDQNKTKSCQIQNPLKNNQTNNPYVRGHFCCFFPTICDNVFIYSPNLLLFSSTIQKTINVQSKSKSKSSSGPNIGDRVRKLSVSLMDKIVLNHNFADTNANSNPENKPQPPDSSSNSTPIRETVRKLSISLMDKISFPTTNNSPGLNTDSSEWVVKLVNIKCVLSPFIPSVCNLNKYFS